MLTRLAAARALVLAVPTAQAAPKLTGKQKAELRQDVRSLMGWSFRLYEGRNPRLTTELTPLSKNRIAVQAAMTATWRGERGVQDTASGVIVVGRDGRWGWTSAKGELTPSKSPAANVAQRQSHVDNAVVVSRSGSQAKVLYSATDRGDELKIATIDTKTRRLVALSKNLSAKPLQAAVKAHRARGANAPNNVVLGELTKNGRAVDMTIYWPLNAGMSTDYATRYRVSLDAKGQPTGTVREVEQRYVR